MQSLQGQCLCGAVKFQARPADANMSVCHCSMCRRWTGGTFLGVACEDIEFKSEQSLGTYHGSAWGERVFCKDCGSSLMWRTQDHSHTHVSVQAFENPGDFKLTSQIFIDEKPDNYAFSGQTQNLTGAEVFAMFAPES